MMKKVLFVCLGNICRSPLAEALFKKHVAARGLQDKYIADSCGTGAYHIGEPPDSRSRANARENGLEYNHAARQITYEDYDDFDLIIAMDKSNMANLKRFKPEATVPIKMMRDYDPGFAGADVPDPYFGGDEGFQEVYDILDRSTATLLDELEKENS